MACVMGNLAYPLGLSEFEKEKMGFKECCSSFVAGLPDPALPMLPSFLLGTTFAAIILVFIYKRQTDMTLKEIVGDVGKTLFCLLPSPEHEECKSACKNPGCIRCQKYKELEKNAIRKFEEIKSRGVKVTSKIENALQLLKERQLPSTRLKDGEYTQTQERKRRPSLQNPTIFYMDLAANSFWNDFDVYTMEMELLKLNFNIILGEFQDVFQTFQNGNSSGWKLNNIPSGHWCIYPFIDQGVVVEKNCSKCPNTATMIGSLPSVMKDCVFGNACFSVLYPDSYIEPHTGPTNLRLRCHLGLSIPDGCFLEVAGTQYKWEARKTMVFDDSFEHSATFKNKPSSVHAIPRAILMIDFWHPEISSEEKKVLLELLAP